MLHLTDQCTIDHFQNKRQLAKVKGSLSGRNEMASLHCIDKISIPSIYRPYMVHWAFPELVFLGSNISAARSRSYFLVFGGGT